MVPRFVDAIFFLQWHCPLSPHPEKVERRHYRICVKAADGTSFNVLVKVSDSIESLMDKIAVQTGETKYELCINRYYMKFSGLSTYFFVPSAMQDFRLKSISCFCPCLSVGAR